MKLDAQHMRRPGRPVLRFTVQSGRESGLFQPLVTCQRFDETGKGRVEIGGCRGHEVLRCDDRHARRLLTADWPARLRDGRFLSIYWGCDLHFGVRHVRIRKLDRVHDDRRQPVSPARRGVRFRSTQGRLLRCFRGWREKGGDRHGRCRMIFRHIGFPLLVRCGNNWRNSGFIRFRQGFVFGALAAFFIPSDPGENAGRLVGRAKIDRASGRRARIRLHVGGFIQKIAEIFIAFLSCLSLGGRVRRRLDQRVQDGADGHSGAVPSIWSILSIVRRMLAMASSV